MNDHENKVSSIFEQNKETVLLETKASWSKFMAKHGFTMSSTDTAHACGQYCIDFGKVGFWRQQNIDGIVLHQYMQYLGEVRTPVTDVYAVGDAIKYLIDDIGYACETAPALVHMHGRQMRAKKFGNTRAVYEILKALADVQ
jgi:hypothetical protein